MLNRDPPALHKGYRRCSGALGRERGVAAQGPVTKAHFIDVGQANATLLELKCGVVLIDAGAQDDEHVDGLVDCITSVFDARPELDATLDLSGCVGCDKVTPSNN